jgi:hypothetical protein
MREERGQFSSAMLPRNAVSSLRVAAGDNSDSVFIGSDELA